MSPQSDIAPALLAPIREVLQDRDYVARLKRHYQMWAGNLLGKQQSGQIAAVGFELYEQMLAEADQELRGETVRPEVEPEIQLGVPAFIPDSYIPDENQRLVFYRRLAAVKGPREIEEIAAELRDRYGPVPPLVDTFLRVMDLRRDLKEFLVVRAALRDGAVTIQCHPEAAVNVDRLVELVHRRKGRFKISADFQISFTRGVRLGRPGGGNQGRLAGVACRVLAAEVWHVCFADHAAEFPPY